VRDRAADRVDRFIADNQVEIGPRPNRMGHSRAHQSPGRPATSRAGRRRHSAQVCRSSAHRGAGNRQHNVGQFGSRAHEEVGVDRELERRQGLAPTMAGGVREKQIGAEADQSTHRVWLLIQDPPV
jgi:hypothetical protein